MAMDLARLLQSKNRALERFLVLSEEFLATAEKGDLDGLEDFHAGRDRILQGLELYDRRIGQLASAAAATTDQRRAAVAAILPILEERDKILARIARCDEKIIVCIERERERVTHEMNSARKAQSTLSKFKSGWVADSGEGLDQKL